MNFCVLVKISKHKVTFWYQSEKSPYAPLIIKETNEVPLYFYVNCNDFIFGDNIARDKYNSSDPNAYGNYFEIIKDPSKHFTISGNKKPVKQLLYYGIEKYLSHFLNTVLYKSGSIESFRQFFPLRILYEADIEDKEKTFIESIFLEAGYDNVERINFNESLFEVLSDNSVINTNLSLLLLNGIENTLYINLYKSISGDLIGFSKIEGQGADPRIKILAEMIIEDIIELNSYLNINKDAEIAAVLPFAAELLENDTPIIKGQTNLSDGKNYSFEVKRNMLYDRLLYHSNDSLYTAIDQLLKLNRLNIKDVIILLASKEINTSYLSKKLLTKYPYVKGIESLHIIETMKLIFSKISKSGYIAKKENSSDIPLPPQLPPPPSRDPVLKPKGPIPMPPLPVTKHVKPNVPPLPVAKSVKPTVPPPPPPPPPVAKSVKPIVPPPPPLPPRK